MLSRKTDVHLNNRESGLQGSAEVKMILFSAFEFVHLFSKASEYLLCAGHTGPYR